MPKTRTTAPPASAPKARRTTTRTTGKKATCAPTSPAPIPEFDAAAHYAAIAQLAYRNWQARANSPGSPEGDWLQAESEIRAAVTN